MNEREFELLYADAVRKYPKRFMLGEPPCTVDEIVNVESKYGFILPKSFRSFLTSHGAGEMAYVVLYSADATSYWSLLERNRDIPNQQQYFAFSDDQCGNLFGFSRDGGDNVYMYDHELGEWAATEFSDFYEYFASLSLLR